MDIDIFHDVCANIWFFGGGVDQQWNISEFTLYGLSLSLLGMINE